MNICILLFGVLLCLAVVSARHMDPIEGSDVGPNNNNKAQENGGERHRRKRYHMNYGYDYQPPSNPFYYPNRREFDRNQDLLPEIYRLLDEISSYIRRPPPPPQPIYIPYAVPYPIYNCGAAASPAKPNKNKPDINSRFPEMHDSNQNWGLIDDASEEEEGDGSRPLSFLPIHPKQPTSRPPPSLEHGTQHARAPPRPMPQAPVHIPDMCDVFSLSCCSGDPSAQKRCFTDAGCASTYSRGDACDQNRLLKIIDEYSKAYAPVN